MNSNNNPKIPSRKKPKVEKKNKRLFNKKKTQDKITKQQETIHPALKSHNENSSDEIVKKTFGNDFIRETKNVPTENQILDTIMECVKIDRMELLIFREYFTNEKSGLYDALLKLFGKK